MDLYGFLIVYEWKLFYCKNNITHSLGVYKLSLDSIEMSDCLNKKY